MSASDLSFGIVKDLFVATQINKGKDYVAYLGGVGADFEVPGFTLFSLNLYYKSENIEDDSFQFTPVYQSKELYGLHFEGFVDLTSRDIGTQNQLLYNLDAFLGMKEKVYVGAEWVYYSYDHNRVRANTTATQVMIKYQF
jgi:nucleoside-specific outer membrane channel protein Tsx